MMTSASHSSAVLFVLLLVLLFVVGTDAGSVSCTEQYECAFVSFDYNYVVCVNNTCQCATANGFAGSAVSTDKCRCNSPLGVYYQGSTPYCISYPQCAASEVAADRIRILNSKVTQVYTNLVYPLAPAILAGEVSVADIFGPNARGRIDPLGTFDTYATLVEYFYVLAFTSTGRVISVDFVDLFGVGNEVFVRVNILFENFDGTGAYNLTQSGRYVFDENNLILSTDLIIHNLGKASNPPLLGQPSEIAAVCTVLTVNPATCPPAMDPTGYYANYTDCVNFLTNEVPFGTFDQSFSNSVACRLIHTLLTVYDPVVHCPHAGKTGGGKCIDVPYNVYYDVSY